MRLAGSLLMGAFGIFLLWVAHYRYEVVHSQLAGLDRVEGMVESVNPNGEFNLKYSVGGKDYHIVRSIGVNFFPRIRIGNHVTLLYRTARPDTASVQQWSEQYPDSAVAGGFGLVAIAIAIGAFFAWGWRPAEEAEDVLLPNQRNWNEPSGPAAITFNGPIELRPSRRELYSAFVIAACSFALAYYLYDAAWKPWIAHTVTVLITLFGIVMVAAALQNQTVRIRANQDGMDIKDTLGSSRFEWKDVTILQRLTRTKRTHDTGKSSSYTSIVSTYLILYDVNGKELLKLDEAAALTPKEDWQKLLAYIPQRTGLPVIERAVENIF